MRLKSETPFIGQRVGPGNTTFVVVDTDGYFNGQIVDNDPLSFCYTHAGGKTETRVASCTEAKRAR
jgi:hypothetical protein